VCEPQFLDELTLAKTLNKLRSFETTGQQPNGHSITDQRSDGLHTSQHRESFIFFANAHFLFFNYGSHAFGTFALACHRSKKAEQARSKEPNFARAQLIQFLPLRMR